MKKIIECPMCDGTAKLYSEKKTRIFRKEEFEITEYFYLCNKCNEEFTTTDSDEVTISQVYNQYREKYKIPSPEQLTLAKEKYGLTSASFSNILGFGVNQFSNYEKGEVPNESNGNLLSLAMDTEEILKLLERRKELFSANQYNRISNRLREIIEEKNRIRYDLKQINFSTTEYPNKYNGFTIPSFDKFANMVIYFLENAPYKTRLNKLLFYADFGYYKYFGKSISGLTYAAIPKGPVPNDYELKFSILFKEDILNTELTLINENEVEKLCATKNFNSELFNKDEISSMEEVLNHFRYKKTGEIIEISHEEQGWKDNIEKKELISYLDYAPLLKEI